jgi:hypothetical protein
VGCGSSPPGSDLAGKLALQVYPTIASDANNAPMTKMTNTIFRLSDIVGFLVK